MTGKPSGGGSPLLPDDVVSGGVLLLVAVAYGLGATRIPSQAGEPGPGFMPMALALLLAALSLAITVGGLRRRVPPQVLFMILRQVLRRILPGCGLQ